MQKIITDEQIARILSLSQEGYSNYQISIELGMKQGTLQYWKKKLRAQGIGIIAMLGRPKRKTRLIGTLAEMERIRKEDEDFNNTEKIKKMLNTLTPEQRQAFLDGLDLK